MAAGAYCGQSVHDGGVAVLVVASRRFWLAVVTAAASTSHADLFDAIVAVVGTVAVVVDTSGTFWQQVPVVGDR